MFAWERIFANFAVRFRLQQVENIRLHAASFLASTVVIFCAIFSNNLSQRDSRNFALRRLSFSQRATRFFIQTC